MADHRGVARLVGHLDGFEGFGQRADLVHLHENRIRDVSVMPRFRRCGVGDEQIVTHQLVVLADQVGDRFQPSQSSSDMPSSMETIGKFLASLARYFGLLVDGALLAFAFVIVHAVLEELGGGGIQGEVDFLARLVAGLLDGLEGEFQGRFRRLKIRRKAAFIADIGVVALSSGGLQGVEYFGAHAQRFVKVGRTYGHDHEFLEVDGVVGVGAAVDDVHHRHGQACALGAADVAVERLAAGFGGGLRGGQRHAENGVGAEVGLVGRAIERDHGAIDGDLVFGIHVDEGFEISPFTSATALSTPLPP